MDIWVASFLIYKSRIRPAMLAMRIQFCGTFIGALQTIECYVNVNRIVNDGTQSPASSELLPRPSPVYFKSLLRCAAWT